jgi:hypothetical protein
LYSNIARERHPYGVLRYESLLMDGAVEEPGNGQADGDVEYVGANAGAHRHVALALFREREVRHLRNFEDS